MFQIYDDVIEEDSYYTPEQVEEMYKMLCTLNSLKCEFSGTSYIEKDLFETLIGK